MSKHPYIVLVGPPNSGKTTLFNWLTGYKRQTVNYPGSTVDLFFGLIRSEKTWKAVDTPGIYGFLSPSPEGDVTRNILKDSIQSKDLRGVILVLDATRLKRQLPLAFQLKEIGLPVILALSMYDIQKKTAPLDLPRLSKELDLPVCPIEGLLGGGVSDLLNRACTHFKKAPVGLKPFSKTWSKEKQSEYLDRAKKIMSRVLPPTTGGTREGWDSYLLHPVFGFGFLACILFIFFSSIFWFAQPVMSLIDGGFSWGIDWLSRWDYFLMDFLANGILAGFGAFFVFIPQVFILFLGIYLLEDSGYLARAVTLVDGPFSRVGLSGKSLFPFLSGFACAIPAVLAARSISSLRERWITIFVLPFMTCSARLPVYVLLLGFLFYGESAWKPGLMMSLIYFLSLLLGVLSAGLLNLMLKPDKRSSFFMELPLYRRPILRNVLTSSWSRTKHFIWKAGPVIFAFSLLMWVATNFPNYPDLPAEQQIEKSYAGRVGQTIEPIFEKMGVDWKVGVGLLSAFSAREVFVPVLAVTLKSAEAKPQTELQTDSSSSLLQTMKRAKHSNGNLLFSTPAVLSLLVFFMFSLQCLSTTGIVYKETGSWKFATIQLVSLNVLAYIFSVLTYHIF